MDGEPAGKPAPASSTGLGRGNRLAYLMALSLVVSLGFTTRTVPVGWQIWDKSLGDVLYAVAVALGLRVLAPRVAPRWTALAAFALCMGIEAFKLTGLPEAWAGRWYSRLVLGVAPSWHNVACYALGVATVALGDVALRSRTRAWTWLCEPVDTHAQPGEPAPHPRWLRFVLGALALTLLLPHMFALPEPGRHLGLPRVYSGDEPHYLIIVNSLLRDGDLDLANNYRAVPRGGDDAGERYRGWLDLDHHVAWHANGRVEPWFALFDLVRDSRGRPTGEARLKDPAMASLVSPREYSSHWPGLPLLTAGLLFPLRHSTLVEPAAILLSWVAVVLAMLAFVSLARALGARPGMIALCTVLTFLGTPAWHYGRTFFTEPYGMACALGAYALFIGRRQALLPGLLLGLAFLLKNVYAVLAIPLGVALLASRDARRLLLFGAPLALALTATMGLNHAMFGSIWSGPQQFSYGSVWSGLRGLLVSDEHGILPYAPVVLCALAGWPTLLRSRRRDALLPAAAFVALLLVVAWYRMWHGGYCFGPRYLVPVLPFLMLGLLYRLSTRPLRPWHAIDIVVLGAISITINAMGALPYWSYWSQHPFKHWF